MSANNRAAWLKVPKARLEVDDAAAAKAGPGEVVIKNAFVAINPVDWKVQAIGFATVQYPTILGQDIAGEVVEVGEGVTRVRVGDRVIAYSVGRAIQNPAFGGFQLYSVAYEFALSPIPDSLPYEQAVVLPLAVSTAAAGLYQKHNLALPYPSTDPKPSGKTIFVWGGSSSVGTAVIQLAVGSGLEVVSTASKRNWGLLKSLGAKHVLDYGSETVVDDIVSLLKGTEFVGGYDAISTPETLSASADIVHRLGGGKLAKVLPGETSHSDVELGSISAPTIITKDKDIAEAIWGKYLPVALANGQLVAKPDPQILKGGLASVQKGLDTLKAGVSAAKVVVEL